MAVCRFGKDVILFTFEFCVLIILVICVNSIASEWQGSVGHQSVRWDLQILMETMSDPPHEVKKILQTHLFIRSCWQQQCLRKCWPWLQQARTTSWRSYMHPWVKHLIDCFWTSDGGNGVSRILFWTWTMSEFGNWIRQRIKSKCIGRPCSHKFVPRGICESQRSVMAFAEMFPPLKCTHKSSVSKNLKWLFYIFCFASDKQPSRYVFVNGPVHFPVLLSTVLVGIAWGLPGGLSMEADFQYQERSSGLLSRISPVPFPFCDIDLLDSMLLCRFTPFPCKDGDLPWRKKELLLEMENCGILTQELEVPAGLQGFGDQTSRQIWLWSSFSSCSCCSTSSCSQP